MPASRNRLQARLRAARMRLVMRMAARAGMGGLAGGAIGVTLATVFLVMLPRLLMDVTLGVPHVLAGGGVGLIVGVMLELRGLRVPTLVDAALAMEARLKDDSGALAAALKVSRDSAFATPVVSRAEADLTRAEHSPAPALVTTRRLIWIPAVYLLGAVAFAWVATLQPPMEARSDGGDAPRTAGNWTEIDVGGGRSEEDRRAYRDALGLKEIEASLRESAATLRDANASETAHRKALDDARATMEQAGGTENVAGGEVLPESVPADADAREELAATIENAASRAGERAESKLESASATRDTGGRGEFEAGEIRPELVPFPEPEIRESREVPAEAIALQSPARRALAERAVKAYENLQQP